MKVIRSVLLSAVLASTLSACIGDQASETSAVSSALTPSSLPFTCGEPPTATPDKTGTYLYSWPIDNDPRTAAYHGTMTVTSSSDGHVSGTIGQPSEWVVNPNDPSTIWDWKVFGTSNGPNLFLFGIPNPHCCDDAWMFELTDQGGKFMSGHEYAGYDHNEEDPSYRFTMQPVSTRNWTLAHGTPRLCPQPVAIPFDGKWTFTWNTGSYGHYCQTGSATNPIYVPCTTSGSQLTLYSEYNDGYLQGYMDPNEHGFLWGVQNGNMLQMVWSPTTFRDDQPWFFEGAYNDPNGNTFLSPEFFGNSHTRVTDSTGHPLAFSMSRTITVP